MKSLVAQIISNCRVTRRQQIWRVQRRFPEVATLGAIEWLATLERFACRIIKPHVLGGIVEFKQLEHRQHRHVKRGVLRQSHRLEEFACHHKIVFGIVPSIGVKRERAVLALVGDQLESALECRAGFGVFR